MMRCCDMTPGMLRTSLVLQEPIETSDGAGGYTLSWGTYATIQAHVAQTGGNEVLQAGRLSAVSQYRATIRYRSDIGPESRAVIGTTAYQIRRINNIEFRDRWIELTLEAGVATGEDVALGGAFSSGFDAGFS